MSCPYYWWNHHYACRKSGKDVNEDIYYKYCRDYSYSDCPIYKGNDSSGCFLTSACVEAKGLPDDCRELTILRTFREGYLRALPEGPDEIAEYYFFAPQIVEKIKALPNAVTIFDGIYENLVKPCVEMIDHGDNEGAHKLYRATVQELKAQYICGACTG